MEIFAPSLNLAEKSPENMIKVLRFCEVSKIKVLKNTGNCFSGVFWLECC
jgi:hypothetical protein